jgi:salicylate hydroxylase
MKEPKNIKIIGGGIAGLSSALAFKNKGIDYSIYEQNSEITYQNVGLGISANIFPILKEWGLLEDSKDIGTEINDFHFVNQNLKYIKSFKMDKPPLSVNRRLFYELFKKRLDKDKIYLNSPKVSNDFSQESIVLSAEGIDSGTRKRIYPKLKLRDSQQILWRGISKIDLDDKFKNAYHDFFGNNLRFAIIHTGQNYYSWYIIKEKDKNENVSLDKAILKSYFNNYHPIVGEVIEKSKNIYFSEILDINPNKRKNLDWFVNNNLMIGDAIHPTTPNMANGACLAMEDSYLLANLLADSVEPSEVVFTEFQNRRTKKINPIVYQSWWFGKMFHQKNKMMDFLLEVGIKITPKFLFDLIYSNILIETTDRKRIH